MGNFYVDLFATKGLEYLLVIFFLVTLVVFWRFLNRPVKARVAHAGGSAPAARRVEWFSVPEDFYYHQGHSWLRPVEGNIVNVGVDDFAQQLLGRSDSVELPALGTPVSQGEPGWKLHVDGRTIDLLSPVNGEVVAVNEEVLRSPSLLNEDPYGKGWLMKVRTSRLRANLNNLLKGSLAVSWMNDTVRALRQKMSAHHVPVLQDGGAPVPGFVKDLEPERWEDIAKEFLMTSS
jgi:glycine cleavage system H lipoate-binding protein